MKDKCIKIFNAQLKGESIDLFSKPGPERPENYFRAPFVMSVRFMRCQVPVSVVCE